MNRRSLRFLVSFSCALLAGPACKQNSPAPANPPAGKPTVALVMKSLANEFFKTMEAGARAHASAHAAEYTLVTNGIKDEQDVGRQIDLVEQMIAQHVDALVLAPADSKALVSAVKHAADAGIVVVNIDNRLDPAVLKDKGLTVPFVGPSNLAGARAVGDHVARALRAGDSVAIIEGLPTAENAQQRRAGFEAAMKAAGIKVAAVQSGNWEMAKANTVASAPLGSQPSIKAFLCANDSMALGAVAALKAANKTGQILVAGFDNISAVRDLLRDGQVAVTADQHGAELAAFGIQAALDILNKKTTSADRETPVDLVTASSLK